jgi:hypothetical protein
MTETRLKVFVTERRQEEFDGNHEANGEQDGKTG